MKNMDDKIRAYVLQNALKYDGKANAGAIIGKLLGEDPSLKAEMKMLSIKIRDVIAAVHTLSVEAQKEELLALAPELLEQKKVVEVRTLKDLERVTGPVVMRFAPSPSGPMHIGHALGLCMSSEYVKRYGGRFLMRIEDTNPANIYPPAYDMIPDEARWITDDAVSEVIIQSDRMKIYYDYAQRLFALDALYVCTCDPEVFRTLIGNCEACPCRGLARDVQLARWEKMFSGYAPGDAVVRVRTDIDHKNPALRDFPVWRITEDEHPRQGKKYRVWPLMNFAVFVDDVEYKMTHVIRSKEHFDNGKRQEYLYRYLGLEPPVTYFLGRINFTDMRVSCSKTRPLIEDGTYSGWDDIRLPFLAALRRRGFQPGAFSSYSIHIGLSKSDKVVKKDEYFKLLEAYNRDIIDSTAHRFSFVWNPIPLRVSGVTADIERDLHPEHKKGGRTFSVRETVFVCKDDLDRVQDGEVVRLIDCCNIRRSGEAFSVASRTYDEFRGIGKQLIHWLPEETVPVRVFKDDGSVIDGLGETTLSQLVVGDVCQLERFGFCRLDAVLSDGTYVFWFAHV